jgi:hypothetical protein
MRYTLAAFGIMASAVLAAPMATGTTDGQVAARGTAGDTKKWQDWGYTGFDDWKNKGGVSTSSTGWTWLLAQK